VAREFRLEFSDLHWLEGQPEERDLCAHGAALVQIGTQQLVTPDTGNGWTLSAAALYLMRTLYRDHRPENQVGDHLVPCCGFNMWPDDNGELIILGCPSGIDWHVTHTAGQVILTAPDGESISLSAVQWRAAVLRVADQVRSFYRTSLPKQLPDDELDRRGYELFWSEWERLRTAAQQAHGPAERIRFQRKQND
jgi:hypothetical protein